MTFLPKRREQVTVERALPAQMMLAMNDMCTSRGLTVLRPDVLQKLQTAVVAPLAQLDNMSISRNAKVIDSHATTLLNDLSPDDPRDGLYCCAMFCLMLVDEGRLEDKTNMAVLVAMLLMDDVKDDRPDKQGEIAPWRLDEMRWKAKAKTLIRRANLMGLYMTDDPTIVRAS